MQLSLVAVIMAGLALIISLFGAFPGLKGVFSVVRDGVLWLAMLAIIGGVGFVVYQRLQQTPTITQRPTLEGFTNSSFGGGSTTVSSSPVSTSPAANAFGSSSFGSTPPATTQRPPLPDYSRPSVNTRPMLPAFPRP
ncbi:hypothetical protein NA78x_000737 [Anatilimnocola sp. NA78]|uniref:hypothetical protein n=1 Tax=Anatilimnocola sp. NA78 TaxID=3415683 RepID=UPI003CE4C9C7